MTIGEVLGTVICTVTAPSLADMRLNAVRVYEDGKPVRVAVAGGKAKADIGEFVYLMSAQEAAHSFGVYPETVDCAVIGRVEDVNPACRFGRY